MGKSEEKPSKLAEFQRFLWNPDTKEVAGRTARSWIEITVFFIVLYCSLAGFWLGLLYLVQLRLPEIANGPLYSEYLTHRGPGVHLVPKPDVVGGDKQKIFLMDNVEEYLDEVDSFLGNHTQGRSLGDCSKGSFRSLWADSKTFCFYVYMNAVNGFVPEPSEDNGIVGLKCKATKEKYEKFISGEAAYFPPPGYDASKFPWKYGVEWDKEAPLVAAKVKFTDELKGSNEGRVNCRITAANVYTDLEKPNIGMVDFRIRAGAEK